MTDFDAINRHKYLYLRALSEPEDNVLRLEVAEAQLTGPIEDLNLGDVVLPGTQRIDTVRGCSLYTIVFDSYIAYAVINESYAQDAGEDRYEGRVARVYTESAFLSYLGRSTFATSEHPGPFQHYALCCLNHIVDVVSCAPPRIVWDTAG